MGKNMGHRYSVWLMIAAGMAVLMLTQGIVSAQERLIVNASIANMRSGPGTKYDVLWQVEQYHPVLVIEKKGSWYKIKDFEGDMAWIHDSLLSKEWGVITIKKKCNVRSEPITTGKNNIVFTVEKGVPFKVLGNKGDWLQIEHADGDKGWIHKSLVW